MMRRGELNCFDEEQRIAILDMVKTGSITVDDAFAEASLVSLNLNSFNLIFIIFLFIILFLLHFVASLNYFRVCRHLFFCRCKCTFLFCFFLHFLFLHFFIIHFYVFCVNYCLNELFFFFFFFVFENVKVFTFALTHIHNAIYPFFTLYQTIMLTFTDLSSSLTLFSNR
jgi:hypothetical protein